MTIHRFIDLVEDSPYGIVPYMASHSGTTWEMWVAGNDVTPVEITAANPGTVPGDPVLSPDNSEFAYSARASSTQTSVRVAAMDNSYDDLIVTHTVYSTNWSAGPWWSPDGTEIVYTKVATVGPGVDDWEVRKVNRDGTGDTLLYSVPIAYGLPWYAMWAPSGDYISFSIRRPVGGSTPAELWTMEADGSSPTLIYTAENPDALTFGEYMGWGFQHSADVIGWCEFEGSSFTDYVWKTINADGTGLTEILNDTNTWANVGASKHSWLPDDSGMVGMRRIASDPDPKYVLYTIAADGSGATAISPERRSYWGTFGEYKYVPCVLRNRIYWVDSTGTDWDLVSIAPDGSDYKVDHALDTESPSRMWRGFLHRGVN